MTLDKFLRKLRRTPRDWRLDWDKRIRRGRGGACQCPISAIGDRSVNFYQEVAKHYGLSEVTRIKIVGAADSLPFTKRCSELRAKLLKACGLEGK